MKGRVAGILLLAKLVAVASASADEAPLSAPVFVGPISLAAAVSRALDESYEARIARLETGRAGDVVRGGQGEWWPQLSIEAQAGYSNRQNERFTALNEQFEPRTYGLANIGNDPWLSIVFDQVLLDLERWRELERDELSAEIAALTEREHAERVSFDVLRRYGLLLRARALEELAREQYEAAIWLADQADQLDEAGRLLAGEREQTQLERDAAALELRFAAAQVAASRSSLWLAIEGGVEPEPWPGVVPASVPEPVISGASPIAEAGFLGAPDLRALALQRRVHEASVGVAKASRYPSLQMRAGYAHFGIKRFDNFEDELYVFVGVEVPIFDGFQSKSRIAGARKGAHVARLEYDSALDGKRVRVRDLERRLALASERLALAERRVEVSRKAQDLADLRLRSQQGRVDDSQQARERTRRDRTALADLNFQRVELWATLKREQGRLAEALMGGARARGEGK